MRVRGAWCGALHITYHHTNRGGGGGGRVMAPWVGHLAGGVGRQGQGKGRRGLVTLHPAPGTHHPSSIRGAGGRSSRGRAIVVCDLVTHQGRW